jgi:hypothetical protein
MPEKEAVGALNVMTFEERHQLAKSAQDSVLEQVRHNEGQRPSDVISAVEQSHSELPDETVRGAFWSLVTSGNVVVTDEGRLRIGHDE